MARGEENTTKKDNKRTQRMTRGRVYGRVGALVYLPRQRIRWTTVVISGRAEEDSVQQILEMTTRKKKRSALR